ncbi:hypothetical protein [Stenotrophomonas tumulicola]|uniref:Uncharacterized protein n=1 Tax=Stenotrophomonas tumulicola TaxID=1685415 RepID=A0A7W3FJ15_9GAMM|nr:hypothetical protein [Stenotrophomonas tumulicola]MBA8680478.1 hypothetical protein [Stenotrophomonas tumulicola]
MKTCTSCIARLPERFFPMVNGRRQARCGACLNTARRLRDPLPALQCSPLQVRLNNTFNLWHGPVSRAPLRIAA